VENSKFKKAVAFKLINSVEYVPNSVVIKSIMKRVTGSVSLISFDSEKKLTGKISPFDTYIQCIEGKAEVDINNIQKKLKKGQFIIIPAHSKNTISSKERFKILSVIIKSGYEDVS